MCIMEVRAGARASTIAQACAHNVSTIERDMDMFLGLLKARGLDSKADMLMQAQKNLQRVYADLMPLFIEFVSDEEETIPSLKHFHPHDGSPIGTEAIPTATLIAATNAATRKARANETR